MQMKQVSIRKQVLYLAFIPLLLVTLCVEILFLHASYVDLNNALITQQNFNDVVLLSLAVAGFIAGLFFYLLWLASGRITDPVIKLGTTVQGIVHDNSVTPDTVTTQAVEMEGLAQGINAMTLQLQQEQEIFQQRIDETTQLLRQKKEIAEHSSQNASRFLAVASHELRQPLHALNLYIEELQRKVTGAEPQHLVGQINHSVEALTTMLNALLDISKLDARTIVPKITSCSLEGLLERVSDTHIVLAHIKNIRLVVRPCACHVTSDQQLLERILMNLVSNAIRYTPANGSVLVACRHRGNKVRIEVRDNGIGIAAADQANIFREFHQCTQPQLDTRKGLGLGLAIVDRLVKLLGLKLTLRSEPHKGSIFAIEVPHAHLPQSGTQPGNQPAMSEITSCLPGKKLLIVDDDPLVLESTVHILEAWGGVVSSADSMEAVTRLLVEGRDWDLVISDYQLEDHITGLDVIRAVRCQQGEIIPCVLITGNISISVAELAEAEKVHLLTKPVRPAKLRSLLEYLLNAATRR